MDEAYRPILKTFEKMSGRYGGSWGMEEANRRALAPLVSLARGLVLDVGCGTGTMIEKYLRPDRHEVVTIDFSRNMLVAASERLRKKGLTAEFVLGIAPALPFRNDAFDLVVCVNTLHNLPAKEDVEAALAEIARVLREGGRAVVEFRNRLNLKRKQVAAVFDLPSLPQKAFSPLEMKKMIQAAGLRVERVVPIFSASVPGGRLSPPLEGIFKLFMPWYAPCFGIVAVKISEYILNSENFAPEGT